MRHILLLSLIICSFISSSQDFLKPTEKCDLKWGQDSKIKKRSRLLDIIGHHKGKHYVLVANKKGYFVRELSSELNILNEHNLDLKYSEKSMEFEGITQIGNRFVVFSSFSNQKLKKNFLFYKTLSLDDLSASSELKKLVKLIMTNESQKDISITRVQKILVKF